MLQTASKQAVPWRDAGLLDTIEHLAVKLSACQTQDAGLMDEVSALLEENGLPARLLELEITEGMLMENVHATIWRCCRRYRSLASPEMARRSPPPSSPWPTA